MFYDARISMGMLFTLIGTILTAFGLATRTNAEVYAKSLGIDANLWWGLGAAGVRGRGSSAGPARPDEVREKQEVAINLAAAYSTALSLASRAEAHRAVVEGVALELVEGIDAENAVNIVAGG